MHAWGQWLRGAVLKHVEVRCPSLPYPYLHFCLQLPFSPGLVSLVESSHHAGVHPLIPLVCKHSRVTWCLLDQLQELGEGWVRI